MAIKEVLTDLLLQGIVIPAHPLALTADRKLNERRQVALTRYYCAAGAGGIAVGVHTTQFAIRNPGIGLFPPVLRMAIDEMRAFEERDGKRLVKIAGVCGETEQALREAAFARECGYDAALLSLSAFATAYHPFFGMWMAITRKTVDGSVVTPEQRISREEALRMWTSHGAYLSFEENEKGSIEPGKLADLVAITRDFLSCPVDEIKDIEAVLTVIDGKEVFRAQ